MSKRVLPAKITGMDQHEPNIERSVSQKSKGPPVPEERWKQQQAAASSSKQQQQQQQDEM
ncbi:hypothetical protein MY4824_004396, partial [Beauveria thailandica]